MTRRTGQAPADFVTPILRRLWKALPEARQEDLAAMLGCDRSRLSHQMAGRQCLPAHELEVWCDFFDDTEPLDAIARRLRCKVVPESRVATPLAVERGGWTLLREVSRFGVDLGAALADGIVDATESEALRDDLESARDAVEDMLAKLSPRAVAPVKLRGAS